MSTLVSQMNNVGLSALEITIIILYLVTVCLHAKACACDDVHGEAGYDVLELDKFAALRRLLEAPHQVGHAPRHARIHAPHFAGAEGRAHNGPHILPVVV